MTVKGRVNPNLMPNSGLPPYHPLVIAQGHDPNGTEIGLRDSAKMAIDAGYNVRCTFQHIFGSQERSKDARIESQLADQ